ncbi:hypothetical protein LINPERHAP2_LOCUS16978 [Linum perenne]
MSNCCVCQLGKVAKRPREEEEAASVDRLSPRRHPSPHLFVSGRQICRSDLCVVTIVEVRMEACPCTQFS